MDGSLNASKFPDSLSKFLADVHGIAQVFN